MKGLEGFGGGDFERTAERGLYTDHSQELVHEVGLKCMVCRRGEDVLANLVEDGDLGAAQPRCPTCNGDKVLWRDYKVIRGFVTSVAFRAQPLETGWAEPGDCRFSPEPDDGVHGIPRAFGQFDKLTATWPSAVDGGGQVILRGGAQIAQARGFGVGVNKPTEDRLWYEPSHAIFCEDEDGQQYQEGDFELGQGRLIRWPEEGSGKAPKQGKFYTLKYGGFIEWVSMDPPAERRDAADDLGPLLYLRKRHVHLSNASPFLTLSDRVTLRAKMGA